MSDPNFYNTPLRGRGLRGLILYPFRRAARKLLLPLLQGQALALAGLARRVEDGHAKATVDSRFAGLEARQDDLDHRLDCQTIKSDNLNLKLDQLNAKFDQLNAKLDELNVKMESLFGKFEEVRTREDSLRDEFAALVALHWDHVALSRRLAQLEDRLIADRAADQPEESSILFPGLERMERPKAG